MTAPAVSAILVNYNAGPELRRALQSVADELAAVPWEALVVDNASTDGSPGIVDEFSPHARLVQNTENLGFGTGVNRGLSLSAAPLVIIMNPDCRLVAGSVAALKAALDADEMCAIAGPRILNPDGSVQGSARGDPDMWTGLFWLTTLLQRLLPGSAISRRNVRSDEAIISGAPSVEVDWLSGACMLARRSAFDRVGGFDERYFLDREDADLCRRLRNQGYRIRFVPGAAAVHRVGQSSATTRGASIRWFHESAYLYYATHVAPVPFHPKRLLARAILSARCWWRLRRSGT